MRIIWTKGAKNSYLKITDFIFETWSSKEVEKFIDLTFSGISRISRNPEMFISTNKEKNIRKGLISKHTSLIYRIKEKEIVLLYFWDNRQDPKKIY